MAMNQKGTLLATIHTSRVQHEGPKDERTGEDEESVDKLLVVWRLEDCTIARLTVLPRSWYSDQVSREDVAEPGKPIPPALAFCGAEYLIVAKRSHSLFSAGMRGCARSFLSGASSRPHLDIYLVSDFLKVAPDLSSLPAPRHQPAPLVGTAVDVPVVRLLTCARTEDVEVVYISPRSTIFWKIDALHSLHGGEGQCPCKMECAEGRRFGCEVRANSSRECDDSAFDVDHRLALHFQFAELPWRMTDDPDLCFTTGCLTRRSASSPTLLLLATNAGFVYGVNFDTNTLLFELQVATAEPVTCIACDRAQDLLCGLGSTLKRWSVNLLSLLPTYEQSDWQSLQASPSRLPFVDIRGFAVSAAFQLDGAVKTMQCGSEAETVVSTSANTIWYLHWNQQARVRLQSGHTGPIRFVCSAYGLTAPCSRRLSRRPVSAEGNDRSLDGGSLVLSHWPRLDSSRPLCSDIFATAGDDLTIRLWSCWPRPQQIAVFSLKQRCCGLAFIRPDVLAALFDNGCLRLIDIRSFRIVGRLQATSEGDAPTSLACVAENHALVATRSGAVLSIQLVTEGASGVSPPLPPQGGPEKNHKTIKHASISRITGLLFGNVGSTLQSQSLTEVGVLSESPWTPPPITHMTVCRQLSKSSKEEGHAACAAERELLLARVAVATRGGVCAIGAYAPNRSSKHMTWMTDQSFIVKVPPRVHQGHCCMASSGDWVQAAFVADDALVICRAATVFLVGITAREVVKKINLLDRLPECCLNERWLVASLEYCSHKKALVLILKGGSFLVLDMPSLFVCSGPCQNVHPCFGQVVARVPSAELESFVSAALIGPSHVLVGIKEVVTSVRIV
uniref:WD domain, G-beta repeat-containing protein n=1 Tax=Neospora caninum (strain Liverpool) TaxID=572307 RepID=A0A0F7UCY7_NEOCL|nr:TPA: WD domain, G-beta repeat-containing protein [Neospora caninum Liverpool]